MASSILTIFNQKGGVGKTTTAVNLAVGLALRRIPTLLVDMDSQANATSSLGFEKEAGASLYGPLLGKGTAEEKIKETGHKHLRLIPGEVDLAALESELVQKKEDYLLQLKQHLQPCIDSGRFRAIVIDCPPALGMLSMNSIAAADHVIVPLQCEYLAMEGLGQALAVIDQLNEGGIPVRLGGIVLTLFDIRTRLSKKVMDEVKTHLPEALFKSVIPRTVRLSEAPSFGQSIFDYDPVGMGAAAYKQLAKECIARFSLG